MHLCSGKLNIMQGPIAYVSQTSWIQNTSLQKNILFLKPMKEPKYQEILEKCCLCDDLRILPDYDMTEIGEKGVNLSGGQKQRVSLARALYQDTDLYLLDDPLSALDSHVGTNIFQNVIGPNGLLKDKTRILVTHNLSILRETDQIIVMNNGKIEEIGNYQELLQNGQIFSKLIEEHLVNHDKTEDSEIKQLNSNFEKKNYHLEQKIMDSELLKEPTEQKSQQYSEFIEKERMEKGKVKVGVFLTYFRSLSFYLILSIVIAFMCSYMSRAGSVIFLSDWCRDQSIRNNTQSRNWKIAIYSGLVISEGAFSLAVAFLFGLATKASITIHKRILNSVMRSSLSFFETTPIGRILNRFGKDIDILDISIQLTFFETVKYLFEMTTCWIIVMTFSGIFAFFLLPSVLIPVGIQYFYGITRQKLTRLHSVMNSPVISNFSETIQGISTIRAHRAKNTFICKHDNLSDNSFRALLSNLMLQCWLSIRLQLLNAILLLAMAIFIVVKREEIDSGIAGLVLFMALIATIISDMLIHKYTKLEMDMVSVERIDEYSKLPEEAPWNLDNKRLTPFKWPEKGEIVFENYQMKYQNNKNLVLKNISLTIPPKQKIGIVGRTGAGKSTFVLAMFRAVEPCAGRIVIDGTDICSLGLHELRSNLTIIPQDPVLFSGTLRMNLDPFEYYSDIEVWNALEQASLKSFVITLEAGLNYSITEGGQNISVGQRQQICLARALLKRTKILILDEATASMDLETDKIIQEVIRQEFQNSTVLTIAHRLATVYDYDRVIVMDEGKIVEDGKPNDLLRDKDSLFYQLGLNAGLM